MTQYLRPIVVTGPDTRGDDLSLVGGWCRFREVEVLERGKPRGQIVSAHDIPADQLQRLTAPRAPFAGIAMTYPSLMGILNVTPDSFSDGGQHDAPEQAMARAREMLAEGADIIDMGGESTRPGAMEVAADLELARLAPVIKALRATGMDVPISVDTRKAAVGQAAMAAGADVINDVSAFQFDPALADVAAQTGAGVVLMHSIGLPETMQRDATRAYSDVVFDVYDALEERVALAVSKGIARDRIMIDPGIGFGKTDPHNLALLERLSLFHALGCPILLGVSRKGMIGRLAGVEAADQRGAASAAVGLWAISQGIQMLRVHDIEIHRQMIALWMASSGAAGEMSR